MSNRFLFLILSFIFITSYSYTQEYYNKMTAKSRVIVEKMNHYMKNENNFLAHPRISHPFKVMNEKLFVDILVLGTISDSELDVIGAKIIAKTNSVTGLRLPFESIEKLLSAENIYAAELSQLYKKSLDESLHWVNASNIRHDEGMPPFLDYAGLGVLLGVVDTGIDFTHPDFEYSDLNKDMYGKSGSKILKIWDMTETQDAKPPVGYNYGREYDKSEIDNTPELVKQRDWHGHGTHVTSIAAGSDYAKAGFRGVAYDSEVIFVKGITDEESGNFSDINIINGVSYIFGIADELKKPAVVNLSLGGMIGPHDGMDLLSYALSEMVRKGRLIVASAGNEGEMPMHAGGAVKEGETVEFPIFPQNLCEMLDDLCPDIPNYFMTGADAWFAAESFDSVTLAAYTMGQTGLEIAKEFTFPIESAFAETMIYDENNNPLGAINYNYVPEFPTNGDANMFLLLHNLGNTNIPVDKYIWSIILKAKKNTEVNIWAGVPIPAAIPFEPMVGTKYFTGNTLMTVGAPGSGRNIISAGSFVTKNEWTDKNSTLVQRGWIKGDISTFSSKGPTRDGRYAPHITAPGQVIFAAKSKDAEFSELYTLEGDLLGGMNGTSMAAPIVAGSVAAMLEAWETATYSAVAQAIAVTAFSDNKTGTTPNYVWGYGKLNAGAAFNKMFNNSVSDNQENELLIYPNPSSDYVIIPSDNYSVFNSLGQKIGDYSSSNLDISHYTPGVYFVRVGNKILKFVK